MTARRRILISGVVLAQPMGGVRRHNVELLPRLAKLAAAEDVGLALLVGKDGLPFELERDIERLACDVPARPALVRATLEGRALRRELARARDGAAPFALVHTAHLPVPRGLEVPYTLTLHDLRSLEGAHTPLSRRLVAGKLVGAAVRGARTVLTVSESVRASLLERFRLAPERVAVVPNAADHFEPMPRVLAPGALAPGAFATGAPGTAGPATGAPGRAPPIVHVGHVEPRKNLELVVRALALDPGLPDFVAHGAAKGGEDERLRELARALGVGNRVHFRGAFEERELAELYARAGAIVLPSRLEGFGISAIEAQRALAPLAIARIPALVEVAGDATPSFAPDDPAECARALRAALDSDAATLAAARDRAARFTWDRSAAAWWRVWRAALGA